MFKKKELLALSRDRLAITLLGVLALSVIALLLTTLFNVRSSDVQVPIRYTGYGFTNLYRDKWYTLWSFALFAVLVFVVNGFVAVKLHSQRRGVALGILSISILITILALIVADAIFRLAAFSL